MKYKITAFERRIEMLFFLTKQRKSSIVELTENYSVCRKTAYNDIMFLSRYAPIYTKGGVNGGVFLMDDYRNSMFLYLSCDEEALLYRIMAVKSVAGNGGARSDGGEVKFLWSVLAKHRLKLLQNKENKLYPSFGMSTA